MGKKSQRGHTPTPTRRSEVITYTPAPEERYEQRLTWDAAQSAAKAYETGDTKTLRSIENVELIIKSADVLYAQPDIEEKVMDPKRFAKHATAFDDQDVVVTVAMNSTDHFVRLMGRLYHEDDVPHLLMKPTLSTEPGCVKPRAGYDAHFQLGDNLTDAFLPLLTAKEYVSLRAGTERAIAKAKEERLTFDLTETQDEVAHCELDNARLRGERDDATHRASQLQGELAAAHNATEEVSRRNAQETTLLRAQRDEINDTATDLYAQVQRCTAAVATLEAQRDYSAEETEQVTRSLEDERAHKEAIQVAKDELDRAKSAENEMLRRALANAHSDQAAAQELLVKTEATLAKERAGRRHDHELNARTATTKGDEAERAKRQARTAAEAESSARKNAEANRQEVEQLRKANRRAMEEGDQDRKAAAESEAKLATLRFTLESGCPLHKREKGKQSNQYRTKSPIQTSLASMLV